MANLTIPGLINKAALAAGLATKSAVKVGGVLSDLDIDSTQVTPAMLGLSLGIPAPRGYAPRVGWSVGPGGVVSTVAGTPVFKRASFSPFLVASSMTVDQFIFITTTSFANAAADATLTLALYKDTGLGEPDFASGPVFSAVSPYSVLSSTASLKTLALATPTALTPGVYWMASLMLGTAATTAGAMSCLNGIAYDLPKPSGTSPTDMPRALTLLNQTALPTAAVVGDYNASTNVNGLASSSALNTPYVTLHRSA